MYEKPKKAWLRLKALADKSRGSHLVEIPGFTKVYLYRDFKFPEKKLRYQFEPFKDRKEGKLIDKAAFDTAWQRKKVNKESIKSQMSVKRYSSQKSFRKQFNSPQKKNNFP